MSIVHAQIDQKDIERELDELLTEYEQVVREARELRYRVREVYATMTSRVDKMSVERALRRILEIPE